MAKTIHLSLPARPLPAGSDHLRGEPRPGFFERWSFEAELSGGTAVTVTFFTKPMMERSAALNPGVSITVSLPGGKRLAQAVTLEPGAFSASREHCLVRIGESWVRCEGGTYELHARAGNLAAQFTITPTLPVWQPAGGLFSDPPTGQSMGWIVPVPRATLRGFLTYEGRMRPVQGTLYHDHRWGNAEINKMFASWTMGRAHQGDLTMLFMQLTAAEAYENQKVHALLLAQEDRVLIDSCDGMALVEDEFQPDPGGRSYPSGLSIAWQMGSSLLSARLRDPVLIDSYNLVDFLPTWKRVTGGLRWNPYHFSFRAGLVLDAALNERRIQTTGTACYDFALLR